MATVSPEVIEKWRREFEEHRKVQHIFFCLDRKADDTYESVHTDIAWSYWLAARQSAVIELPENNSCYDVVHDAIEEIADAIKAQGYRVNFNQPTQG